MTPCPLYAWECGQWRVQDGIKMDDNNIIKFERPKPKKEAKPVSPTQRKALIWLALVAALIGVWSYYQFVAPPSLPGH
ncbi:hypothetical protein D9M68_233460 [compost metagenome]|nr:hypothetical protein N184_20950 [Sinorhizobium sp. GL28]